MITIEQKENLIWCSISQKLNESKVKKNMHSYKKSELYSKSCSFGIFEYVVSDSEWISHPFNVDFGKIK